MTRTENKYTSKNKLVRIIFILILIAIAVPSNGENWRHFNTFCGFTDRIVDTPDYTYFLNQNQEYIYYVDNNKSKSLSLFRYDKKGNFWMGLRKYNLLSDNLIQTIAYNPDKRYLMVAYTSGNIDIIYDNQEKVVNIPDLKLAGSEYSKNVNNINFDPERNRAYLATDFGYIEVSDVSHKVVATRNFGKKLNAVAPLEGSLLIATDQAVYADTHGSHKPFDQLQFIDSCLNLKGFYPCGNRVYAWHGPEEGWKGQVSYFDKSDAGIRNNEWMVSKVLGVELRKNAIQVSAPETVWCIDSDLKIDAFNRAPEDVNMPMAGWEGNDFWIARGRRGYSLQRQEVTNDGVKYWNTLIANKVPNASNAFWVTDMYYHPDYGMMLRNNGYNRVTSSYDTYNPDQLCAYKDFEWTPLSITWKCNRFGLMQSRPNGLTPDPLNPHHIYSGSVFHGILRVDLDNQENSLRFGRKNDWGLGDPGYIPLVDDSERWSNVASFAAPRFDKGGNMWTTFYNFDKGVTDDPSPSELWCWTPDDRLASTSPETFRAPKRWTLENNNLGLSPEIYPIQIKGMENKLLILPDGWSRSPLLYDTKGTPDYPEDDEIARADGLYEAGGGTIDCDYMRAVYQDVDAGRIWIGTTSGIFYIIPKEYAASPGLVHKVKVSRNDGTNLADYLLDGVFINSISQDPEGNLWIGTMGGGLVCVSRDGTEVIKTYTAENSELPDNRVYATAYNPSDNSIMISTEVGLCALFLENRAPIYLVPGLKCYPNPVTPDFYGYVTISGLPQGALVKVVDARGNLVKELNEPNVGETTWDVTDLTMKRVPGGVYYILASGAQNSNFSANGKILVIE